MTKRRTQAGFTMVELLVTLTVSVIGIVGVLKLHLVTNQGNAGAAQTTEALTVAQQTIEEARSLSLDAMYAAYEDDDLPIEHDFGGETVIGRTASYLRRITVVRAEGGADLLKIRVEVRWGTDGASPDDPLLGRVVSLELIRTRQETL